MESSKDKNFFEHLTNADTAMIFSKHTLYVHLKYVRCCDSVISWKTVFSTKKNTLKCHPCPEKHLVLLHTLRSSGFQSWSWGSTALHILYVSLIWHTQCSSWISLLMSWLSESGVLNKGDMLNVERCRMHSGGFPGVGLKTTALERHEIASLPQRSPSI